MAWIYPGAPTCSAPAEYSDGRKIDILKAEYFTIDGSGNMNFLTEQNSGCNAYSAANVASLKKYSSQQYATFSSSYSVTMNTFLTNALAGNSDINTLVSFAVDNKITGIELDFEDFGGWTAPMYANYKQFIIKLGNALHSNNKKLMVDGPATSNAVEQNWYAWRYADFNSLPVDKLVVMTYDYQYDQGPGAPVSPISWIQDTIKWTLSEFSDKNKISFGIPSYGYKGIIGTQKFSLLTYNQLKAEPGFSTAMRDSSSGEMTWQNSGNVFFYQDGQSMLKKLQAIQALGIKSVSVWHLGGNLWFAKN
jgi:spore germination protein YaaH